MQCYIYRSTKKWDSYLYICNRDDFSEVPEALMKLLGKLEFAMELELSPERKLAREDVEAVMKNLTEQGYYLQLPPAEYDRA